MKFIAVLLLRVTAASAVPRVGFNATTVNVYSGLVLSVLTVILQFCLGFVGVPYVSLQTWLVTLVN
ncbi:MAG: hypothetical protein EHM64_12020 [Ignavibacteriae bacterium]|nr:MAG: hypothetical protein EHM64_12020 [Ignavibacteriota bacterium]